MEPNSSLTILAVDDDPVVLKLVGSILTKHGYRVLLANDGAEALAQVSAHPDLALVVTDVRMPQMSGIELADSISRLWPDLELIFVTGYPGDCVDRLHGRPVVTKPFHPAKLIAAIEAQLAKRQPTG